MSKLYTEEQLRELGKYVRGIRRGLYGLSR